MFAPWKSERLEHPERAHDDEEAADTKNILRPCGRLRDQTRPHPARVQAIDGQATLPASHLHDQGSTPVSVRTPTPATQPSIDYRGETRRQGPPSTSPHEMSGP